MAVRYEKILSALDIGTSKVSALIAGVGEDGELTVLGTGQRESKGVVRGHISDIGQAELSVRQAVEQAERIAGVNIEKVWLAISAGGLDSMLAPSEIDLGGDRIEQMDIDDLLLAGRDNVDMRGKLPLHINPALYAIDGVGGVANPLGLHADRLGVDIHVILAEPAPVRNLDMTARAAHLGVEAMVAAPIAAGHACLTDEERELGVAVVEMGAGVTNVSVFIGGLLTGLATLNQGAADITDDIASVFGIRRAEAERLKCYYGSAISNPRDHQDVLDIAPNSEIGDSERPKITRAQLNAVICQRIDAMIAEIGKVLKDMGFTAPGRHHVVLTGGGAELKGLADHMQAALGRAVRIGRPKGVNALPDAHSGPAFSTLVGLALYANSKPLDLKLGLGINDRSGSRTSTGSLSRIWQLIKENF
ncbi:cell division protein FtsA [Sphingorhabdus sp.]|jgi:cell division protein FtsA|uniref:cell division protein FtsA n=1 Tax=Sphingorhabdus sp. TaxID=1902408 RepID=UPI003BAE399C|nr:cell division protein FtsA [Sphingomonadales bacterium]